MHRFSEAARLAALGYRVFPCVPGKKTPLTPNGCLDATTDEDVIESWWTMHPDANIGLSTDGLIVVDVDPLEDGSENLWLDDVHLEAELLGGAGTITPRGGSHFWFRQPEQGKWKNTAGQIAPRVDTRANGGYVLVPDSATENGSYRWKRGFDLSVSPEDLPEPPQWLLDKLAPKERATEPQVSADDSTIPEGKRNDTLASIGGSLRRIGLSESEIYSALCAVNVQRCRPPLGDAEVKQVARSVSKYDPDQVAQAEAEGWLEPDLSGKPPRVEDPGVLSANLLHVPGLLGDYMQWVNETAFVPQPILSLAAGLAMFGSVTGRKITDELGTRTNLYCLGVCESGGGKEHARKCTKEALTASGLANLIGPEGIASHSGLIAAIEQEPCVLVQIDEIGRFLKTLKNPDQSPHLYQIVTVLMSLYTSADSQFVGHAYADTKKTKKIDQPNMCLYGTTVKEPLLESLTRESLTEGLIGRLLIFEAAEKAPDRESPVKVPCPAEIAEQLKFWRDYLPGGNLSATSVQPRVIRPSDGAAEIFRALRKESRERGGIWVRAIEKARKLALLFAASQDRLATEVDAYAAEWACSVVRHTTERMAYLADRHVAAGQLDASCKLIIRIIEENGGEIRQNKLTMSTRGMTARQREDAIRDLINSGEIVTDKSGTKGRPATVYRIT